MPQETLKHDFSGVCAPGGPESFGNNTFSVGIFQWVPTADKKACKKSAVKVRVRGLMSAPEAVYQKAREIVLELDNGTYNGKRNVTVKESASQ